MPTPADGHRRDVEPSSQEMLHICLLWESARKRVKEDEDDFRRGGEEIGTRVGCELMWPQGLASIWAELESDWV